MPAFLPQQQANRIRSIANKLGFGLALLLLATQAQASTFVLNPKNAEEVDSDRIAAILIGKEKFWNDGSEIRIALLKSDSSVQDTLKIHTGMTLAKFRNHWQRIAFTGRGKMPRTFSELQDLLQFVRSNPGAIALVPTTNDAIAELRALSFDSGKIETQTSE